MDKLFAILAFLLLCFAHGRAQSTTDSTSVPAIDIILCDLKDSVGIVTLSNPINITDRPGYDNQPAFTPDGKQLLYTSVRSDSQSDIYSYDIATHNTRRVTETKESEYSATPWAGKWFSTVRVEMDSAQRLWRFNMDGSDPVLVYPSQRKLAYHAWLDDVHCAMIVLGTGDSMSLRLVNVKDSTENLLAPSVGRCAKKIPDMPAFSFVQKNKDSSTICVYDPQSKAVFPFIATLPGSEDYDWMTKRRIVMGSGSKLFISAPPVVTEWHEIADLARYGYSGIARIAISPQNDKIAIVVANVEKTQKTNEMGGEK